MIKDATYDWGLPTISNSNTETVSPYVTDLESAQLLFTAATNACLWFRATITADANPTIQVNVVGADNAALTTNPIILASTGVIATKDGLATALASGDTVERRLPITSPQQVAKRYYGLLVTLGGTNPDLAAGQDACIVFDAQTHLVAAQAAVPAT